MSDEEGRLEAAIPLVSSAPLKNIAVRQLPARRCAVLATDCAESSALDLASSLDVLFDWFDRRGYRAAESPAVSFTTRDAGLGIALSWAFDPLSPASAR